MREEDYNQLNNFEKKYWWHIGRKIILSGILKKYYSDPTKSPVIIDFGCGTGGNYNFLSNFGKVFGVDNSKNALAFCRKKNQQVKLIDGHNIPFQKHSAELIVALDVLEHLKDDVAIIKECQRVLKKKGRVLITVPAYKFMWSDHDEILHHHRRYALKELENKFEQNGFKILRSSYFVTFLFPLVLAYRIYRIIFSRFITKKVSYLALPKILNDFFLLIMKIESFFLNKINLPFGSSIVAVFEKRN